MQKAYELAAETDKPVIASVLRQWGAEVPAS
jgi:hypothetical protein